MTSNQSPQRRYLPTFAELIDRLSIAQLKEVFIPKHKKEYSQEIAEIMCDLNSLLEEKDIKLNAKSIRALIVLAQMNLHIWHNESQIRAGGKKKVQKELSQTEQKLQVAESLELTHGLNGIRNDAKNRIQEQISENERKDYKIDCLAAKFKDWKISWEGYDNILELENSKNKEK